MRFAWPEEKGEWEGRQVRFALQRVGMWMGPCRLELRCVEGNGGVELELIALEITNLRVLSATANDSRTLGPEVSVLKIKGSEIQQALAELQMQALGPDALPYLREALDPNVELDPLFAAHYRAYAPPLAGQYFNLRKTSIYAGSNEIQRNITAQHILGL